VINLRGIIVPIFDLRARFGMGTTHPTRMHVVIIVRVGNRTTGLLVDGVSDIITVAADQIRPVPDIGLAVEERFLEGLVALDERMVTLVCLDGLIRVGDMPAELPQVA
jgi:purine-binding chemotaxis protein CheW